MQRMHRFIPLLLAALLAGCATIVDGGGQVISVNSVPAGASCSFTRDGAQIGLVPSTPGSVAVDKSRKTIVVSCDKADYQTMVGSVASASDGAIWGNMLFGGLIGLAVDWATSADYYYGSNVTVTFAKPPAGYSHSSNDVQPGS